MEPHFRLQDLCTNFLTLIEAHDVSHCTGSTAVHFGSRSHETALLRTALSSSLLESDFDTTYHQSNSSYQKPSQISSAERGEAAKENMTAGKLMDAYESCISNLRKTQSERGKFSRKKIVYKFYKGDLSRIQTLIINIHSFKFDRDVTVSEALLQEITLTTAWMWSFINMPRRSLQPTQTHVTKQGCHKRVDSGFADYSAFSLGILLVAVFMLL
ncbi:hypothetical protein HAX54_026458 [Datura stramonium]|uniref:Uncharacterized protein n=1 Tax=Datura stramonium TaxID=4076 RepID=A0ABS8V3T4_DATST|nr:hypothetical protein [Datura stramonium]